MASHGRRSLLAVTLIIVAIILLAPKVIGIGIREATIQNLVALVPPEADSRLVIEEGGFASGWFGSSATVNANYTVVGTELVSMVFDFKIQHGPLLLTEQGPKLGVAYAQITPLFEDSSPLLEEASNLQLPDILIEMLVTFDQSLALDMTIAPAQYKDSDIELEFAGLSAGLLARADQSAELYAYIGTLSLTEVKNNQNLSIGDISIRSDSSRLNDILAPSTATFTVSNISSTAPMAIDIADITVSANLSESVNPAAVRLNESIAAENISTDIPLTSFAWELELDQVQRQLVSNYYELLYDLQSQANTDPDAAAARINEISQELSLLVINNPLTINNRIETVAYGGSHSGELLINWNGLPQLSNIARLNINEAIAALEVTADLSMDLEAISRSPGADYIDAYLQQGFIIIDNGRMLLHAELAGSRLTLNGEDIPLDQFF